MNIIVILFIITNRNLQKLKQTKYRRKNCTIFKKYVKYVKKLFKIPKKYIFKMLKNYCKKSIVYNKFIND